MSFKNKFAIGMGKATRGTLKMMKRQATSLPGKVAMNIDRDVLNSLSENTKFVFITGTNGKTMTTAFITNIMRYKFENTITNDSGANMIQGIVTSLLDNENSKDTVAVLEVDEANLRILADYINPDYIVLTNIFEDQMDRFKSTENTLNIILDGIEKTKNTTIIANGDLPLFAKSKLKKYRPVYFGVNYKEGKIGNYHCPECGAPLEYEYGIYDSLGKFTCNECGLKNPTKKYTASKVLDIKPKSSSFMIEDKKIDLKVGGIYNIYNATAAWALAKEMGISEGIIKTALEGQNNLQGRQEEVLLYGKEVVMNLVKNKAGFDQVLDIIKLEEEKYALYFLINNNFADGKDISWLNEVDYGLLKSIDKVTSIKISGEKANEFQDILIKNGITETVVIDKVENLKQEIKQEDTKKINVLANYTALNDFRESIGL